MEKEKEGVCSCGERAIWMYMPCSTGNEYFCDSCVPRGCSCNRKYFADDALYNSATLEHLIEKKLKFRVEDMRISDEDSTYLSHKYAVILDNSGRELPCCEFWSLESHAEWSLIGEF